MIIKIHQRTNVLKSWQFHIHFQIVNSTANKTFPRFINRIPSEIYIQQYATNSYLFHSQKFGGASYLPFPNLIVVSIRSFAYAIYALQILQFHPRHLPKITEWKFAVTLKLAPIYQRETSAMIHHTCWFGARFGHPSFVHSDWLAIRSIEYEYLHCEINSWWKTIIRSIKETEPLQLTAVHRIGTSWTNLSYYSVCTEMQKLGE